MSFTTEIDRPTDGPKSIRHTRGLWLRRRVNGDVEMWVDGGFEVSWGNLDFSRGDAVSTMLRKALEIGESRGRDANAKQMREALGL